MKTTLDLPDHLMTEVKIRAAKEQRKMKDIIAEALEKGLGSSKTLQKISASKQLDNYLERGGLDKQIAETWISEVAEDRKNDRHGGK